MHRSTTIRNLFGTAKSFNTEDLAPVFEERPQDVDFSKLSPVSMLTSSVASLATESPTVRTPRKLLLGALEVSSPTHFPEILAECIPLVYTQQQQQQSQQDQQQQQPSTTINCAITHRSPASSFSLRRHFSEINGAGAKVEGSPPPQPCLSTRDRPPRMTFTNSSWATRRVKTLPPKTSMARKSSLFDDKENIPITREEKTQVCGSNSVKASDRMDKALTDKCMNIDSIWGSGRSSEVVKPFLASFASATEIGSPGRSPLHSPQDAFVHSSDGNTIPTSPRQRPSKIRRTQSMCQDAAYDYAGSHHDSRLNGVGELCILPHVTDKDSFKRIFPETLIDLMEHGRWANEYDEYHVIDCRFQYEYEGGHIRNARNISRTDDLEDTFLRHPIEGKRVILIFHCEFSSHRAPKMAHYLRSCDRQINAGRYPKLHYPEVYILYGGYRSFYDKFKSCCEPQGYIEMKDDNYREACAREMSLLRRSYGSKRSKSQVNICGSPAS